MKLRDSLHQMTRLHYEYKNHLIHSLRLLFSLPIPARPQEGLVAVIASNHELIVERVHLRAAVIENAAHIAVDLSQTEFADQYGLKPRPQQYPKAFA